MPFSNGANRTNIENSRNSSNQLPSATSKYEYKRTDANPLELRTTNTANTNDFNGYQNNVTNQKNEVQNTNRNQPPKFDYWDQPSNQAEQSHLNQSQDPQIKTNIVQREGQFALENVQKISSAWLTNSLFDRPPLNPNNHTQDLPPARKSVFDRLGPYPRVQDSKIHSNDRPVMQSNGSTNRPEDMVDHVSINQPSKIEQKVLHYYFI